MYGDTGHVDETGDKHRVVDDNLCFYCSRCHGVTMALRDRRIRVEEERYRGTLDS